MNWYSKSDRLQYSISESLLLKSDISKRQILSEIAQIYDPFGLLSPTIILAKIIIQKLWSQKLNWDESIPDHYRIQWIQFRNNLKSLNSLKIPRDVIGSNDTIVDIHCFCDASQYACSCCF